MLDSDKVYSVAHRMRVKRLQIFVDLLENVPRPCRILDVGGEPEYWRRLGFRVEGVSVVCANLQPRPSDLDFVETVLGDATGMPQYDDRSFDVVHSNSVIEHLFTWKNQQAMAAEVRRIGKRYWVQTPNKRFPIEPHFLFPYWQYLPKSVRMAMLRKKRVGFLGPCATREEARHAVDEFRLLTRAEFQSLFPEASLITERWKGLAKSFVAHHGF